jgi:hypothetical protein
MIWEPFPPDAHSVTPKFALAFAPSAGALVVANPLEWTFTDQTTLAEVGGVAATAAEGVSRAIGGLAQLHSAARVATAMAELAIGAGIDADHCRGAAHDRRHRMEDIVSQPLLRS